MAILSDIIENYIKKILLDTDGMAQIKRNELAIYFKCVPSQINYVISTRFTQNQGYYVESRRGGGGHIIIRRILIDNKIDYLMHVVMSMGNSISQHTAEIFINNFEDYKVISKREAILLKAATSNCILSEGLNVQRDEIRASILKNMLMGLLTEDQGNRGET